MASQGGLTRRRGAGGATTNGDEESSSRVTSPGPRPANSYTDRTPETAYESGENGHKIAYDPQRYQRKCRENETAKAHTYGGDLVTGTQRQAGECKMMRIFMPRY